MSLTLPSPDDVRNDQQQVVEERRADMRRRLNSTLKDLGTKPGVKGVAFVLNLDEDDLLDGIITELRGLGWDVRLNNMRDCLYITLPEGSA